MKIKFLATGVAPEYYEFQQDILTAYYKGEKEVIDFSEFAHDDTFEGIEMDVIDLVDIQVVREAVRDSAGTLYLTLCQASMSGVWRESSEWLDSKEYDKQKMYIEEVDNGQA